MLPSWLMYALRILWPGNIMEEFSWLKGIPRFRLVALILQSVFYSLLGFFLLVRLMWKNLLFSIISHCCLPFFFCVQGQYLMCSLVLRWKRYSRSSLLTFINCNFFHDSSRRFYWRNKGYIMFPLDSCAKQNVLQLGKTVSFASKARQSKSCGSSFSVTFFIHSNFDCSVVPCSTAPYHLSASKHKTIEFSICNYLRLSTLSLYI